MLVFLSLYVMLSILLSILDCAAASLFCACLVSVQVSAPYVIAGSTQELYTCLFRQKMVSLVRELLRVDRAGIWSLNLYTVPKMQPLLMVVDCTNYLCWCSLCIGYMRKLPDPTPESRKHSRITHTHARAHTHARTHIHNCSLVGLVKRNPVPMKLTFRQYPAIHTNHSCSNCTISN